MTRSAQQWPPVDVEPAVAHPDAPAPGSKLGVHFAECFGCGDELEAGLHLQSMIGDGHVVHSKFVVTADVNGILQGAFVASAWYIGRNGNGPEIPFFTGDTSPFVLPAFPSEVGVL